MGAGYCGGPLLRCLSIASKNGVSKMYRYKLGIYISLHVALTGCFLPEKLQYWQDPPEGILPHMVNYSRLTATPVLGRVHVRIVDSLEDSGKSKDQAGSPMWEELDPEYIHPQERPDPIQEELDIPVTRIGVCSIYFLLEGHPLRREIWLLRSYVEGASEEMLEQLVFHELGHCLHMQGHTETGLMQPILDPEYPQRREEILSDYLELLRKTERKIPE